MALKEVLIDELRDMYSAENQLVKALPKLAKGARSPKLKQGLVPCRYRHDRQRRGSQNPIGEP
jgi:ferritin-like metal-binding protein YciE